MNHQATPGMTGAMNPSVDWHQWLKRSLEDQYIASDRASVLQAELGKSPVSPLQLAKSGLETMESEWHLLNKERISLEADAEKAKVVLDFKEGQQGLKELSQRQKQPQLELHQAPWLNSSLKLDANA